MTQPSRQTEMVSAAPPPPTQEPFGPWRIMTPEEYAALTLKGRHTVERDFDGFGNVAVWLSGHVPPPTQEQELAAFHNRLRKMLHIDFDQLIDAGVMAETDHVDWRRFMSDPWRWFIRASDEDAAKVWAIMEKTR